MAELRLPENSRLTEGKTVPAPILDQMIDFTKNFTIVCHHGKEEDSLFPALERSGMPKEGGPVARMLFEHGAAKDLAARMEVSARKYSQTNDPKDLVADIRNYVDHVSSHLTKENFRLFMMADMILKGNAEEVSRALAASEQSKLAELGKGRQHYEKLVSDVEGGLGSPP